MFGDLVVDCMLIASRSAGLYNTCIIFASRSAGM
jgi:hypothetical protein